MSLEIKTVRHIHDMAAFVDLPLSISAYARPRSGPQPDSLANYDPQVNPVHRHLETAYFLALRGKVPVGRIAAVKDFLNPDAGTGFFGCFESEDDAEAASALVDTARRWLAGNGCLKMIGPATFNTNQQVGILIEGYDAGPQIMLPFNPPYYGGLMEKSGLVKHADLVTFSWYPAMGIPEKIARLAERVRSRGNSVLRTLNLADIVQDARLVRDMFNRSMSANWGYIPLTIEESLSMISFCRQHADRDLLLSVWVEGRPAGILLFLPTALSGPGPSRTVRAAVLGVVPEYRHRGLDSYLIERSLQTMFRKGYGQADISMIHEENKVMIRIVSEVAGCPLTRRYRVYGTG